MSFIDNVVLGFETALTLHNVLYSFIGVFIGNLIGVLPGIGAMAAISMLLPITYGLDPAGALMMLAGLYYGTSYGGAVTSILLNLPGTATHAVVCLDGNPMALQGRAAPALFSAMISSFIGATAGVVLMMVFSPLLVQLAFQFGPTEYFALMLLGLVAASSLTTGSPLKGIAMVLVGLILGVIGTDVSTGTARFTLGITELHEGLSLIALAMGLFGIADTLGSVNKIGVGTAISDKRITIREMWSGRSELKRTGGSIGRGLGLGSFFGLLPGTGGTLASFMSYALEKKVSKEPQRFGHGAIEGVAGPEAANSSAAITAFVPTLTLGIPGDAVMALMLGALMIHNIQPGPQLMVEHPTVFWGLIASFWIGNAILLILNIPLIRMWVKLLSVPYHLIYPAVLFFICIGVYSGDNNLFDIWIVLLVGVFGYLTMRLGFEPAPMLLAFVLGPMVEENFRRAMLISRGDLTTFVNRPISAVCLSVIVIMISWVAYKQARRNRLKQEALNV